MTVKDQLSKANADYYKAISKIAVKYWEKTLAPTCRRQGVVFTPRGTGFSVREKNSTREWHDTDAVLLLPASVVKDLLTIPEGTGQYFGAFMPPVDLS